MRRFAFPVIGHLSVAAVDSSLVHKVLLPLVATKPDHRIAGAGPDRDRCSTMPRRRDCDPAIIRPTKSIIANMLPLRPEKARVVHQPALPFAKVPELMAALRATAGTAARLLELMILTGMRSEAPCAPRGSSEFDFATDDVDHSGEPG